MQVEEDPSSQFVDFTNATALEQFVSDAEQTLIGWHLAGKGHAAAEALAAAAVAPRSRHADSPPTHYTRVLEFEQPPRKPDGSMASASATTHKVKYAITLFLARPSKAAAAATAVLAASDATTAAGTKQWQQGREHFTPTMLAIADAKRDQLVWTQGHSGSDCRDATTGAVSASAIAASAMRWFGVDEFVLVTRTSLPSEREKRLEQQQQQQALTRRLSRTALVGKEMKFAMEHERDITTAATGMGTGTAAAFDGTMDMNEANLLLSAIHVALLNCNCTIPAFVPIQHVARGTWLGTAVPGSTGNVSMHFETDATPEANSNQSCISGLMDFFQLKLQLPPHMEDRCRLGGGGSGGRGGSDASELSIGSWVSAAFRYAWLRDDDPRESEKPSMDWRCEIPHSTESDHSFSDMKQLSQVLFGSSPTREHFWGAVSNPIAGIELTTIWPILKEGTYVDNAVHSTLDPRTAPEWVVDVHFETKAREWLRGIHDDHVRKPIMPLSRVIANLVSAYSNAREINRDVLVSELAPIITSPPPPPPTPPSSSSSVSGGVSTLTTTLSSSSHEAHSLSSSSRLPSTIPAARAAAVFGNAIGSITSSIVSAATWKGADIEEIQHILAEIFDGAENSDNTAGKRGGHWSVPSAILHSAPVGELVSVLACRMGQLHGLSAMSLLWVEFVKSLRERWFQQRLLPLLSTRDTSTTNDTYDETASRALDALFLLDAASVTLPNPDFRQCLLYQKLQLLNTCILRQAEEQAKNGSHDEALSRSLSGSSARRSSTRMSDLTAFALDEEEEDGDGGSPSDDEFFDSVEVQDSTRSPVLSATGVRRPLAGMTGLTSQQPLMEPVTQAAVPLTEDIAKQQQELLSRLGVGPESTMLRQQLQSAALISDMQAFKAANPGACLADFIRWYSPKDWIHTDSLSATTSTLPNLPLDGQDVWWFKGKGMLSERMRSTSGQSHSSSSFHVWHEMWKSSPATPVSKQRRLFDPVGESEKLYHYLETISPHEMFHQMLVGAMASCYTMLERACLPVPSLSGTKRLTTIDDALHDLRTQCDRAVSLLDEAYAESQVALPTGRDQKEEHEKFKSQLQVAFEMALDACRTMTRTFEQIELMLSQASALFKYFSTDTKALGPETVELVDSLLSVAHKRVARDDRANSTRCRISQLLRDDSLRRRISSLVLDNAGSSAPVHREYVIRCICPRPFLEDYPEDESEDEDESTEVMQSQIAAHDESAILDLLEESPVVVNRMYACFTKETVRFALTLAESEF